MSQVLSRFHPILQDFAFAANTGKMNVPVDHIEEMEIGVTALAAATTATTFANLKDCIVEEYVMTLGGIEMCRLDFYDMIHMQNLWFGETPQIYWLSGADGDVNTIKDVRLPLSLDKKAPGSSDLRSLDAQFMVGALTGFDTATLQFGAKYISDKNVSWLPKGYHYAYQYVIHTFASAGQRYSIDFPRSGADLVGLVVRSTTVPITTSLNTTVDQLTVLVNDQPVYGPIHYEQMPNFKGTEDQDVALSFGEEIAHYSYLDFSRAPLPADNIKIWAQSVGATDTGRFIGIFMEP
jgi:hypothetical protein